MPESSLVQLNFKNNSYSVYIYVFSMVSFGCILIDLVVVNLLMHSLPGMILLYLATSFLHQRCFCMNNEPANTFISRKHCLACALHEIKHSLDANEALA